MKRPDADLRDAFAGLRREDRSGAPGFDDVVETALRRRFATLRADDARRAPGFEEVVSPRPTARGAEAGGTLGGERGRRRVAAALLAASLAAVSLWATSRPDPLESALAAMPPELRHGTWRAPTDFLLDFDGRERIREIPRLPTAPSDGTIDTNS